MFNCKAHEYDWPTKFKSRLVARGDMPKTSIGSGELFALIVAVSSVTLLVVLACEQNLDLCHFDVEQSSGQSDRDEDVFVRLPQGCGSFSGMIVKLNKSLYDLKLPSMQWHAHLTRCLLFGSFLQCLTDACVFYLMEEGLVATIIVVHVDDTFAVGGRERCDQ